MVTLNQMTFSAPTIITRSPSKALNWKLTGDEGKLYGDLTIKGNTKQVVLNVEAGGVVVDPYGQTKSWFYRNR